MFSGRSPPSAPAFTIAGKPAARLPADPGPGPGEFFSGVSAPTGPAFTMGRRHKKKCCKKKVGRCTVCPAFCVSPCKHLLFLT